MDKKNTQKEEVFKGKVNDVEVSGKTYKEFTINYLTELVNQYKNLPDKERVKAYLDYFLANFNYDKVHREDILSQKQTETFEGNEKELFTLLHDGKGVCQQFAQAIALLSVIDQNITKSGYFRASYANCRIFKGRKMGHAINLCSIGNDTVIIDVSSMIHARDKDYKLDKYCFGLVSVEDYMQNLKQEDCEIIPIAEDLNETYLACFSRKLDVNLMYDILNLTTDELNDEKNAELNRLIIYRYDLPKIETFNV